MVKKKKKKNRSNNNGDSYLPSDIIIYSILTKVPNKSLNRFRCVCKHWSNLFDDFVFVNTRRMNQQKLGLIYCENNHQDPTKYRHQLVSFDIFVKEETIFTVGYPQKYYGREGYLKIDIQHACNGQLILCYRGVGMGTSFYVYNPITRCSSHISTVKNDVYSYSLTYDAAISKYKVFKTSGYSLCQIMTVIEGRSSERRWRNVLKTADVKAVYPRFPPVFVNGFLHWISFVGRSGGQILSLDVSNEILSTIGLPGHSSSFPNCHSNLMEMGGLLWLVQSISESSHLWELWFLKKNNLGEHEWVFKCSFDTSTMAETLLSKSSGLIIPFGIVADPKLKIMFNICKHDDHYQYKYLYDIDSDEQSEVLLKRKYEPSSVTSQIFQYSHP